MATSDLAERAREAFVDDDFQLAVDLYSQAIDRNPSGADLFADRAQANIKLHNFTEAVSDTNKAIELDPMMAKAYLRKGTACFKLEEYHTAKAALEKGASLVQNDSRYTKLIKECDERIAEENCNVTSSSAPRELPNDACDSIWSQSSDSMEVEQRCSGSQKTEEIEPTIPKYRHSYYQKPEEVVLTIFAKGIPANNVCVEFGQQILSVVIDIPGENNYYFQPRLFATIVPDKCRFEVLSTKIEIRLVKVEAVNWPSLEYCKEVAAAQHVPIPSRLLKPAYPSSKPKRIDWDKLEAQVKKEEKEEKLDGDAAVNKLFGTIYKDADEDTRRAMMKSFTESNGTVLSTDWKDVGSKKVEGSPPEGMELKKWEY